MTIAWFEPRSFSEWLKRAFGLRPMLVALLMAGVLLSELRFDWIERIVGAYLVTTNSERPESGAIWEVGHRNLTAQRTLEKIIAERLETQREVSGAATLKQVADIILNGTDGVMLSPAHFRTLYLGLPASVSQDILSPYDLIAIISSGNWDRTFIEKKESDLVVYLLDEKNRVLRQLEISADLLYQIDQQESGRTGSLENLSRFADRIYPAQRFFSRLDALPEDVRKSILPQPESLLKIPGRINRVGISDEAVSGFIELGFEIESGARKQVVIVQGREWAVWLLRTHLENVPPPSEPLPVGAP